MGIRHLDSEGSQISTASEMTNTAILAGRVLLILLPGCMILTHSSLIVMMGGVLMGG